MTKVLEPLRSELNENLQIRDQIFGQTTDHKNWSQLKKYTMSLSRKDGVYFSLFYWFCFCICFFTHQGYSGCSIDDEMSIEMTQLTYTSDYDDLHSSKYTNLKHDIEVAVSIIDRKYSQQTIESGSHDIKRNFFLFHKKLELWWRSQDQGYVAGFLRCTLVAEGFFFSFLRINSLRSSMSASMNWYCPKKKKLNKRDQGTRDGVPLNCQEEIPESIASGPYARFFKHMQISYERFKTIKRFSRQPSRISLAFQWT